MRRRTVIHLRRAVPPTQALEAENRRLTNNEPQNFKVKNLDLGRQHRFRFHTDEAGSAEASLKTAVHSNPERNHLSPYFVILKSIFGNLRFSYQAMAGMFAFS